MYYLLIENKCADQLQVYLYCYFNKQDDRGQISMLRMKKGEFLLIFANND